MKASINSLHHQDTDWLRELQFYKDELAILTKRLEEPASKNSSKEVMAQVEHFQNKFIVLREQVDILKHDVNVREKEVESLALDKPSHIDEHFTSVRDDMHKRMIDLAKSIADTRYEFNRFLAKNM
jgi:cell division septum initiation protein DivIVA